MKTVFTELITSLSFDWKLCFFAGVISVFMLIDFGCYSISTGKHWHMPILFALLAVSNLRAAYIIRKKTKNCEQQTEPH
jgi:hypothetical protein